MIPIANQDFGYALLKIVSFYFGTITQKKKNKNKKVIDLILLILIFIYNTRCKKDKFVIREQLIHQQSIFLLVVQLWLLDKLNFYLYHQLFYVVVKINDELK